MRLVDADRLIKALETEIERCDKLIQDPGGFFTDKVEKRSHCIFAIHLLKSAPTVECPGGWNLCESAMDLPPSGTACFVTVECNGEKSVCISTFDHGTGWSNLEHGERVVSWMRLPEAYDGWEKLS